MFIEKANTTFINEAFSCDTIAGMHETTERLYQAAALLTGNRVTTQTAIANLLNVSPQTVNNWEARGVSKTGMIQAQQKLGCSVTWLETGAGTLFVPGGDHPETRAATRLKMILSETGLTLEQLAKAAGTDIQTVADLLNSNDGGFPIAIATKLQDALGYNAVWITQGVGNTKAAIPHGDDFNPIPLPPIKKIPVVAMAQLGDNGHFCEMEYPVGHGDGYLHFFSSDPNAYGIRCVGDSMEPRIKDGEFVVIEPGHVVESGDEVLVKSNDGRVMVKTLAYKRGGAAHLLSVNMTHATVKIPLEQIQHMHFVAAIVKASAWRPD